jgi:predicted phage-related endonuclease
MLIRNLKKIAHKKKIQKAKMKNQLRKELNEAIKGLQANVYKNWRETDVTGKKIDNEKIRLIHDLFFARKF